MKRREFISLLAARQSRGRWRRARSTAMPVVGYLSVGAPPAHPLAVFKQSLAEAGQAALRAIGGASLGSN
jgi:hypothetical protein